MKSIWAARHRENRQLLLQKSQALPEKRKVRQKQMASVMEMFMEHMYMEFLKKKK